MQTKPFAVQVRFENTVSGLTAEDVQAAIDEINLVVSTKSVLINGSTVLDGSVKYLRVDTTNGDVTIELPLADMYANQTFHIKKISTDLNDVVIIPSSGSGETIEDMNEIRIKFHRTNLEVHSTGTLWDIR